MTSAKTYFLHLVMGEIGGVGKSWFAKLLIEAYINMKLECLVVDTDESTPNVGITYDPDNYSPVKIQEYNDKVTKAEAELLPLVKAVTTARSQIVTAKSNFQKAEKDFSASQSGADGKKLKAAEEASKEAPQKLIAAEKSLEVARGKKLPAPLQKRVFFVSSRQDERSLPNEILDLILDSEKDAVVNLPAQVGKIVNTWVKSLGLADSMLDEGIETICWFVAKPSMESIDQLTALRDFHGEGLKIVLVKNHYVNHPGRWENILTPGVLDLIKSMKITQIDLSDLELPPTLRVKVDQEYCKLSDLANSKEKGLGMMAGRINIKRHLAEMLSVIKATGFLPEAKALESEDAKGENSKAENPQTELSHAEDFPLD